MLECLAAPDMMCAKQQHPMQINGKWPHVWDLVSKSFILVSLSYNFYANLNIHDIFHTLLMIIMLISLTRCSLLYIHAAMLG